MDRTSLLVLETLQRLIGTSEDVSGGFFFPITISHAIGMDVEDVCDEYDILRADGLLEVRKSPEGSRVGRLAGLTPRGEAFLAENRKHDRAQQRAAESASESSSTKRVIVRTRRDGQINDVFLSYASEDRAYALALKNELNKQNISVWIDVDEVKIGDTIIRTIEDGIKKSRFAILLISRAYMKKPYPKAEFDTIIKGQIEKRGGPAVIPILHGDVSQNELTNFSGVVSTLRNVSTNFPLPDVVNEILNVIEPPSVTVSTPVAPSQGASNDHPAGMPDDALADDTRLAQFRPRLNLTAFAFNQASPKEMTMTYDVQNVGNGSASKVSMFLPGVLIERLPGPVAPGGKMPRTIALSEREAYISMLPVFAQVVVEFEDHAGNLYRQYGTPIQKPSVQGRYKYEVEELDRPYLVPQRIIPLDDGRGFTSSKT